MPVRLEGSCRCGAVRFTCDSHAPVPYQRCYCGICRKTAGGGGYAINLSAIADSLVIEGGETVGIYRAMIEAEGAGGTCRLEQSSAQRHFCTACASALWLFDPRWPELLHPFASAIDSELPTPPAAVHLMLAFKPAWVVPQVGPQDELFDGYPSQSIEAWHKARGLWVA